MRRPLILAGSALFALAAGVANAQTQGATGASVTAGPLSITGPAVQVQTPTTPSASALLKDQAAKVGAKADAKVDSLTQPLKDKADAATATANQANEKAKADLKAAHDAKNALTGAAAQGVNQGATVSVGGVQAQIKPQQGH